MNRAPARARGAPNPRGIPRGGSAGDQPGTIPGVERVAVRAHQREFGARRLSVAELFITARWLLPRRGEEAASLRRPHRPGQTCEVLGRSIATDRQLARAPESAASRLRSARGLGPPQGMSRNSSASRATVPITRSAPLRRPDSRRHRRAGAPGGIAKVACRQRRDVAATRIARAACANADQRVPHCARRDRLSLRMDTRSMPALAFAGKRIASYRGRTNARRAPAATHRRTPASSRPAMQRAAPAAPSAGIAGLGLARRPREHHHPKLSAALAVIEAGQAWRERRRRKNARRSHAISSTVRRTPRRFQRRPMSTATVRETQRPRERA